MSDTPPLPKIRGFDRQGEPELRHGENGGLELIFNFMPPRTATGVERMPDLFEHFESVLTDVLSVKVTRDDRELFLIAEPKPETAGRLANYLDTFWRDHAKPLSKSLATVPRAANAPFRNAKDFRAAALEQLAPVLKPLGFKKAAGPEIAFKIKTASGRATLVIWAHEFSTHYEPSASVFIWNELIERIYAPFSGMEEKYWPLIHTLYQKLDFPAPEGGYRLRRPSDARAYAAGLADYLRIDGLALIGGLGEPAGLEQKFNDQSLERAYYLDEPQGDQVASKGLILARLLGRPDIEAIAAWHRMQLAKWDVETPYPRVEAMVLSVSRDEMLETAKVPAGEP